jgi:predicted nucleotidyltransferase
MFARLLARISEQLDLSGLGYMVIGGQAVLVHGEPRLTRDIDVVLAATVDELAQVQGAIEDIGLDLLVDLGRFARETRLVACRDPESGIRIDFLLLHSPYEREALGRAVAVRVEGRDVRFASVEDVVILKLIAGRPRDIDDARSILLKNQALDASLVRRWLGEYARLLARPLLEQFETLVRETRIE